MNRPIVSFRTITPILTLLLLLMFAACEEDSSTGPPDDDDTTDPGPTPQLTLNAESQTPDNGTLTCDTVVSRGDGWLVVHRQDGAGQPLLSSYIGKLQVDSGLSTNLVVPLDSAVGDNELLFIVLHRDSGVVGTYEYAGPGTPDAPVYVENVLVGAEISIDQTDPNLEINSQVPLNDSITVLSADVPENSWLVLTRHVAGGPSDTLLRMALEQGRNRDFTIDLPDDTALWVYPDDSIRAFVLVDRGAEDQFEPGGPDQQMVNRDGEAIETGFTIQAPMVLRILVQDQEVIGDTVIVDEITSNGPGWVVIQRDNGNGGPVSTEGVGHTRISTGVNSNVVIKMTQSTRKGTPFWIVAHVDASPLGEYDPRGDDGPVYVGGQKLTESFVVQ